MQYAPTHTCQKSDSYLLDESETCKVFWCMSLRLTQPRRVNLKICMDTCKTRRGLDGCDQCHVDPDKLLLKIVWVYAKPSEDWTNMVIFTENSARIGWVLLMPRKPRRVTLKICMRACKTRLGLDEYGHFHAKPAEDGTDMAIFTRNPPRIGRIWSYSPKTRRGWDEYGYFHAKPAEDWTNMAIFTRNPARIR